MSYHIYSTEGFILSSTLAGESNRFYHVYTKEMGLIGVWGQGVRKLESKLRFHLQDFSHVRLHVVRGKHLWRLTDVENISLFPGILLKEGKRIVMGHIAQVMKRLLEEGKDEQLYSFFLSALYSLEEKACDIDELKSFELLFVLRLLHHLGYGKDEVPSELTDSLSWEQDMFDVIGEKRPRLTRIANTSLQQTHM